MNFNRNNILIVGGSFVLGVGVGVGICYILNRLMDNETPDQTVQTVREIDEIVVDLNEEEGDEVEVNPTLSSSRDTGEKKAVRPLSLTEIGGVLDAKTVVENEEIEEIEENNEMEYDWNEHYDEFGGDDYLVEVPGDTWVEDDPSIQERHSLKYFPSDDTAAGFDECIEELDEEDIEGSVSRALLYYLQNEYRIKEFERDLDGLPKQMFVLNENSGILYRIDVVLGDYLDWWVERNE